MKDLLTFTVRVIDEASGVFRRISREALMFAKTIRSVNRQLESMNMAPSNAFRLTQQAALDMSNSVSKSQKRLQSSVEDTNRVFSEAAYEASRFGKAAKIIETPYREVEKSINHTAQTSKEFVKSHTKDTQKLINNVKNIAGSFGHMEMVYDNLGNSMIQANKQMYLSNDKLASKAYNLQEKFSGLQNTVQTFGSNIVPTLSSSVNTLGTKFESAGKSIKTGFIQTMTDAGQRFTTFASQHTQGAQKIIKDINSMRQAYGTMKKISLATGNEVLMANGKLYGSNNRLMQSTYQLQSAVEKVKGSVQNAVNTAVVPLKQGIGTLTGKVNQAKESLVSFGGTVQSHATSAFNTASVAASNFGTAVMSKAGSSVRSLSTEFRNMGGAIRTGVIGGLKKAEGAMSRFSRSATGLRWVLAGMFGGIALKKMYNWTIGLAITREKLQNVTYALMGNKKEGEAFFNSMDRLTNNSLVDLDSLSQAMIDIRQETGMSNDQLKKTVGLINDIGQRAILMGKTGQQVVNVMQGYGRTMAGASNNTLKTTFGITKTDIKNAGWSGNTKDVEGYNKALQICLERSGRLNDLMKTTTIGRIEGVKKMFRIAGRDIGNLFLPVINGVIVTLMDINTVFPQVTSAMIALTGAFSGLLFIAPVFNPIMDGLRSMKGGLDNARTTFSALKGETKALETVIGATSGKTKDFFTAIKEGQGVFSAWNSTMGFSLIKLGAIAAIVGVVIYVLYQVGKSLGYWKDFETLLEAIEAGIERVWKAFKNDEDVKALWNAIKTGAGMAKGAIEAFNAAIGNAVPEDAKGKFDAVGWAIRNLAEPLKAITAAFLAYKTATIMVSAAQKAWAVGQAIYKGLQIAYAAATTVATAAQMALNAAMLANPAGVIVIAIIAIIAALVLLYRHCTPFREFVNWAADAIKNNLGNAISWLISVGLGPLGIAFKLLSEHSDEIKAAFGRLASYITGGFISAWNRIAAVPGKVYNYLRKLYTLSKGVLERWVKLVIIKAGLFLLGIYNKIKQVPGKVYNSLAQVVGKIQTALGNAVNTGKNYAQKILNAIINIIKKIPERIGQEFAKIPGKIRGAVGSAINAAKNWAISVKNAALSPFQFGSPGIIYRRVTGDFAGIIDSIKSYTPAAYMAAERYSKSILSGFGDPSVEINKWRPDLKRENYVNTDNRGTLNAQLTLIHDFQNLPENISDETLSQICYDMSHNDSFIHSLTSNIRFQEMDLNMKQLVDYRYRRSNGE